MSKKLLITLVIVSSGIPFHWAFGQAKKLFKPVIVSFYNLENFYDTINDPFVKDDEFTPTGEKKYNTSIYHDKLIKLSTVLEGIGKDINPDGAAIFGVAEIENKSVLEDLVNMPLLKDRKYKIVHYNSPDERGIDVGFLYNPKYFKPDSSQPLTVTLEDGEKKTRYTRDILWVRGNLLGERVHVLVNHWPSRLGGESKSAPARATAARVCLNKIKEIEKSEPNPKFIIMGDLNDDPVSPSISKVLKAKGDIEYVGPGEIYNPWVKLFNKGIGTLAFGDSWNLFDQIMITYPWLDKNQQGLFFHKQFIYNKEFMVENSGRYKGYPMRTWDGSTYRGGYSDHFPTYLVFLKNINPQ